MRTTTILTLMLTFAVVGLAADVGRAQETWAERLGFPRNKKVVVISAQDMGAAYEFNRTGQEFLENGRVHSASVLVAAPWFEEFAAWRKAHEQYDVGVAITLVAPSSNCRWRPLVGPDEASSLVDADGYFWSSILKVGLNADAEQVEHEARAQIELARAAGLKPTHLMTQMGVMVARADLAKVYLNLAREYWIPAVMVELTPQTVDTLRADGLPISDEVVELVNSYPLPKVDHISSVPEAESYEKTKALFLEMLTNLPAGEITQIIARPADPTPGLQMLTPRAAELIWQRQLLSDPDVLKVLEQEDLVVTNWKEMMERFESEQ